MPCFVTGLGAVTAAGLGRERLWQHALNNQSALHASDDGFFLGAIRPEDYAELRESTLQLMQSRQKQFEFPIYNGHTMTLYAMREAMAHAGWENLEDGDAIIFATTTGQIPVWEVDVMRFLARDINQEDLSKSFRFHSLGLTLSQVCEVLEFSGPTQVISSACAASTHALILAKLWLSTGRVKRCLVGATEVLCQLTKRGFDSFQLLAKELAAPFDAHRAGINLSEGSAFLCLESNPAKKPLAEITGGAITADAYHMTAPHPEGKGCALAMMQALEDAELRPEEISWIHAHGTGSQHNDSAEAIAIRQVFGEPLPAISSSKAIHGHALAACGVIESVLCLQAMQNQTILGTHNLKTPDPQMQITMQQAHKKAPIEHIIKNTLGFGGSNGSVIFSRSKE